MARWKLMAPHYLDVPGTVWEQIETDRETGRQRRKAYPVPLHLDPNNPADWNYKPGGAGHLALGGNAVFEGEIIVAYEHMKHESRDIIFRGDPTPDMKPLDDEAEKIHSQYAWSHPIEELSTTFSDAKLSEVQEMFAEASAAAVKAAMGAPAQNDQIMAMQKQMVEMMGQMSQAMTAMMGAMSQQQTHRRL